MILFFISLLAGLLTVLAPCTISLLPVIVGGTLSGGSSVRRIITVTLALGASVIAFTLLLKASTALIAVPQSFWQGVSGVIIIALGIAMIFPKLWESLSFLQKINRESNKALATGYQKQNVWGDILTGAALGPVFSSCSPTYFLILATVLPRSIPEGIIYLLAYTIGLCGGLFVVAMAGQRLLTWLGIASDPKGTIKRVVGGLFLLLGVAIFFGYDKKLELYAAEHFFDVTQIEQKLLLAQSKPLAPTAPTTQEAPVSDTANTTDTSLVPATTDTSAPVTAPGSAAAAPAPQGKPASALSMGAKAIAYPKVPEITNASGYINTGGKPITIGEFKGKKVVLLDFWTYSCINCQRTIPYIKAWYEKYHDQGLEIISIHTPEFAFEHVLGNVQTAVNGFGIKYPVVLDNDYGTWNAFGNQFWPRKYLVDIDGYIVYDHAGEGNYAETEKAIQHALAERATRLGATGPSTGIAAPTDVVSVAPGSVQSPEAYFGSARNQYLANGTPMQNGAQALTLPVSFETNKLYLGGTWNFSSEFAENTSASAQIRFKYSAKNVYFVASAKSPVTIHVTRDGGQALGSEAGKDVDVNGNATVSANRLYDLIKGSAAGSHVLEIEMKGAGLDAYTFTFG